MLLFVGLRSRSECVVSSMVYCVTYCIALRFVPFCWSLLLGVFPRVIFFSFFGSITLTFFYTVMSSAPSLSAFANRSSESWLLALHEHIRDNAPIIANIEVRNQRLFNVRRATDVLHVAEAFIEMKSIPTGGLDIHRFTLNACNTLVRMRLISIVEPSVSSWISRRFQCFVFVKPKTRRGRWSASL